MKDYKILFIENFKSLLKEKNMSQADIAKILSVDQTTISAWSRGESEPTLTKICAIMEYFSCRFEDLIE